MTNEIKILQLYSKDMNIYGDWGNVLTVKRRLEWRGFRATIVQYNVGDELPTDADIILGGGGQDSGQDKVAADLISIKNQIFEYANNNTPILVVCGLYQQFGKYFKTKDGQTIPGIGLFDTVTVGGNERFTGNIICESDEFGKLVGFENHSGVTQLANRATPLAKVVMGAGNNNIDATEGVRYKNAIGTYLHGPILPKNPILADFLIKVALKNKFNINQIEPLDDSIVNKSRLIIASRPR